MSKTQEVLEYFSTHPDAKASEVAKKFGASMATVYRVKKHVKAVEKHTTPKAVKRTSIPEVVNNEVIYDAHYKALPVEPWEVVDGWPLEQQLGYHRGNAIKYLMRMGMKATENPEKEIAKAKAYVLKLEEVYNNQKGA